MRGMLGCAVADDWSGEVYVGHVCRSHRSCLHAIQGWDSRPVGTNHEVSHALISRTAFQKEQ